MDAAKKTVGLIASRSLLHLSDDWSRFELHRKKTLAAQYANASIFAQFCINRSKCEIGNLILRCRHVHRLLQTLISTRESPLIIYRWQVERRGAYLRKRTSHVMMANWSRDQCPDHVTRVRRMKNLHTDLWTGSRRIARELKSFCLMLNNRRGNYFLPHARSGLFILGMTPYTKAVPQIFTSPCRTTLMHHTCTMLRCCYCEMTCVWRSACVFISVFVCVRILMQRRSTDGSPYRRSGDQMVIRSWSDEHVIKRSRGQAVMWSSGHVVRQSVGYFVRWSSDQMDRWSDGHAVRWSGDHVIKWSRGQAVTWSGDHVVRWSSAQIAKWSVIRSHGQSVRRLSGQLRSVLLASGVILHLWDALDVVHESASAAVVHESASAAVHECTCTWAAVHVHEQLYMYMSSCTCTW